MGARLSNRHAGGPPPAKPSEFNAAGRRRGVRGVDAPGHRPGRRDSRAILASPGPGLAATSMLGRALGATLARLTQAAESEERGARLATRGSRVAGRGVRSVARDAWRARCSSPVRVVHRLPWAIVGVADGARRRRGRVGAVTLLVVVVVSCGSIDDEELQCEEAVARLEDCCPSFEPRRFNCRPNGCNGTPPALTEDAAECIRERGCSELRSSGSCDRLVRISREPYPSFARDEIRAEACR